jgi:hypothetical protein
MQGMKRTYVDVMQALGSIPGLAGRPAEGANPYGIRRWIASLFAIYDTERMVALDCPWWNVAATRAVERFLAARPGAQVFEYGAGASTIWLARRAGRVVSVEHDPDWFGRFRRQQAPFDNAQLLHRPLASDGGYVEAIAETGGLFDLIVVDGRRRTECLRAAILHLAPGGIIVFDDSGRTRYREGIAECGLRETRHFGRSFCVPYPDHTSILRRDA